MSQRIDLWPGRDVPLWNAEIADQQRPSLEPYLVKGEVRGAVIVCPGGGYRMKAAHEGAPIAEMLNKHGIHAFVLDYRVAPYRHPAPLLDAQRAVRYVRHHAKDLGVKPDKIGILGFSAGGHLCASVGTQPWAGDPAAQDPVDRESARPDAFVPCYAVLSMYQFQHLGSVANLLGNDPAIETLRSLSPEENVTAQTPPAFLWHTAEDATVAVENSLLLAMALSKHKVPFSLHVYPEGRHGIGLGGDVPLAPRWADELGCWLTHLGFS